MDVEWDINICFRPPTDPSGRETDASKRGFISQYPNFRDRSYQGITNVGHKLLLAARSLLVWKHICLTAMRICMENTAR